MFNVKIEEYQIGLIETPCNHLSYCLAKRISSNNKYSRVALVFLIPGFTCHS